MGTVNNARCPIVPKDYFLKILDIYIHIYNAIVRLAVNEIFFFDFYVTFVIIT